MRKVLAAGLALLALAGCQRQDRKVVAVVPKATSHKFWLSVKGGAERAGKEFNVAIDWNGPTTETDFARQIQLVEAAVSRRVDGIALAPGERQALVSAVDRARAAGIPVTVFDSALDGNNYGSYVASDNYAAGILAGKSLARFINRKGKVAIIKNAPGSASTMERERGFLDAMKEYPEIQIVAEQYGRSDRAVARAAAENILTAHPDLAGLFGSTDPSAYGAALAIKSRGLSGKVRLVAFDLSPELLEELKGGTVSAMVIQDPELMGYEAVRTVVEQIRGRQPERQVQLPAVLVTGGNLNQPAIERLLTQ